MGAEVSVLTIVGALVLCGLVTWFVMSRMKKEAYQGVVVDKKESTYTDSEGANYSRYTLVVKCDDGSQKSVTVGRKLYGQFAVNDRIVKEAGKLSPTKA